MSFALYLDTSALLKLYVEEAGSTQVAAQARRASLLVTATITYAEARAALAARARRGDLSADEELAIVDQLDADWPRLALVQVTEALAQLAGELAHLHALRGYDAIQLAACMVAKGGLVDLRLAEFDEDLTAAAAAVDIRIA